MTVEKSKIIGLGLETFEFIVDWTDETKTLIEGDSLWSDGITANSVSPSGLMVANISSHLTIANIIVPNGTSLNDYTIFEAVPVMYMDSALSGITISGWYDSNDSSYTSAQVGMAGAKGFNTGELIINSGSTSLVQGRTLFMNRSGYTGATLGSRYVGMRIVCGKKE